MARKPWAGSATLQKWAKRRPSAARAGSASPATPPAKAGGSVHTAHRQFGQDAKDSLHDDRRTLRQASCCIDCLASGIAMRRVLTMSRLAHISYADGREQAHTASSSTLRSSEHGHAPVAPDLPRAPRAAQSSSASPQFKRRRCAPPPGPAAALPLPPTNILGLLNEISEDPHEGANAAACIGWPEHALSVAKTLQGSASANAQPLDTPYILDLMQTIHENDLHDGPELDELANRIEQEGKQISQHSAIAPDVPRLLQAIHEKNSAQGNALAELIEQIERAEHSEHSERLERESATALPNPDVHILLQEIRERLPADQATALAELVERSERPSPDRKTTCFPLFRRARS
ncbi:type III effector protein XopY [Xanthomonas graminis]|uniref:type III effector protein XopY n=1 Tax=Xanthomonas graminis TaxID=3390026 RepID=UPI001F41FC2E|nr:type III effector protein XopY [Xanthomonas translucens]